MSPVATPGPLLLDALSLLSEVADDLVVKTVRDTHLAALDRVGSVTRGRNPLHRGIAGAVYGSLSLALSAASRGLDTVAATGVGPRLEDGARGPACRMSTRRIAHLHHGQHCGAGRGYERRRGVVVEVDHRC